MFDNETIKKIRESRMEISARFDHDPKRFIEYYKEKQKTKIKSNVRPSFENEESIYESPM